MLRLFCLECVVNLACGRDSSENPFAAQVLSVEQKIETKSPQAAKNILIENETKNFEPFVAKKY